ncbi:MAG: type I-U CRISPR-associated protein Cas5/Cas6 [Succinivibrionaceae bacterium]|nr:type I-U CRISPR-associated protein Cas5/Cas6 [Succinivibrionaceae bacterium]
MLVVEIANHQSQFQNDCVNFSTGGMNEELRFADPAWLVVMLALAASLQKSDEQTKSLAFVRQLAGKIPSLWSYEDPQKAECVCLVYDSLALTDAGTEPLKQLTDTASRFSSADIRMQDIKFDPLGGVYLLHADCAGHSGRCLTGMKLTDAESPCLDDFLRHAGAQKPPLKTVGYQLRPVEKQIRGSTVKYRIISQEKVSIVLLTEFSDRIHKTLVKGLCQSGLSRDSALTRRISGYDFDLNDKDSGNGHIHIYPLIEGHHIQGIVIWYREEMSNRMRQFLTQRMHIRFDCFSVTMAPVDYGRFLTNRSYIGMYQQTVGKSRIWRSLTPFVPPRYVKPRGSNTLEGQVAKELSDYGIDADIKSVRVRKFHEYEGFPLGRGTRRPKQNMPLWVEIEFESEVAGPIMLGYGSRFGLGLFARVQ